MGMSPEPMDKRGKRWDFAYSVYTRRVSCLLCSRARSTSSSYCSRLGRREATAASTVQKRTQAAWGTRKAPENTLTRRMAWGERGWSVQLFSTLTGR